MLLLCLHGLLPISFRGSSYNIPINIWIPRSFHEDAPIVYVVPTSDMVVKVNKTVDHSGRVDVGEWNSRGGEKSRQSTLEGLIEGLKERFGNDPPVYAKKSLATPPPPPPRVHQPPPPPPPVVSPPPPTIISPPPPPLHAPPPPPPPPPPMASPPPPFIPPPNILESEDVPTTAITAAPTPPRPPNPLLLSLHDSLHSKLSSHLSSLHSQLSEDASRLRLIQSQLLSGPPSIQDEQQRLQAVQSVCQSVSSRLRPCVDQAQRNVEMVRTRGEPEVDEVVCSTEIVYNQLWELVAEDNAIEDTIYHLHRALCSGNNGKLDLDRFLRATRILAEEQFMKRALIEKIQQGLPMGARAAW
ncbi:Suppressor protein stp22 of temperature-sensitive alpha-factor receptor and arginine permease [Marasmius crinis-equi]|uniref:Suppressor protein stp22 of temperature-sensitive alpha-factor receptor and arginine permease n=1 Tax=Marasmius crinis-equi TaxID=585013 RepID=A0ABR3EKJ7_9AGAR